MITVPIHGDGVSILPSTLLYLRVSDAAVELVSTEGVMRISCDYPRFLMRDLQAGRVGDFISGTRLGTPPFDYVIASATLSRHREAATAGIPENFPLARGTVLLETSGRADYHDYQSIQIVGITKHQRLYLGFTTTSYHLVFAAGLNLTQYYREEIKFGLLKNKCAHFSMLPHDAYLNWCAAKRLHCTEIIEVEHRPDSWGGLQEVTDLSAEPNHALFKTRITQKIPAQGMDL